MRRVTFRRLRLEALEDRSLLTSSAALMAADCCLPVIGDPAGTAPVDPEPTPLQFLGTRGYDGPVVITPKWSDTLPLVPLREDILNPRCVVGYVPIDWCGTVPVERERVPRIKIIEGADRTPQTFHLVGEKEPGVLTFRKEAETWFRPSHAVEVTIEVPNEGTDIDLEDLKEFANYATSWGATEVRNGDRLGLHLMFHPGAPKLAEGMDPTKIQSFFRILGGRQEDGYFSFAVLWAANGVMYYNEVHFGGTPPSEPAAPAETGGEQAGSEGGNVGASGSEPYTADLPELPLLPVIPSTSSGDGEAPVVMPRETPAASSADDLGPLALFLTSPETPHDFPEATKPAVPDFQPTPAEDDTGSTDAAKPLGDDAAEPATDAPRPADSAELPDDLVVTVDLPVS